MGMDRPDRLSCEWVPADCPGPSDEFVRLERRVLSSAQAATNEAPNRQPARNDAPNREAT